MKQLEVQIMGQNYVLGCPENSETRLRRAVDKVDAAMCKVRDAGRIKARDRIAVLVALNLAFELLEALPAAGAPASGQEADAPAAADEPSQPRLDTLLRRLDSALASVDVRRH